MKQKLKHHKGITLIALIITIIVLLILAVVAISAVKGEGIIAHAKNAKSQYSGAQTNEQSTLQGYLGQLDESQLASKKVKDNLNKVLSTGGNITLEDDFGNKIKVPAGFKILVDSTTGYTVEDIDVTKGIVVEDEEENQFVWIPVGTIYTDTEKTEANAKTITLGRYENFTKNADGTYTVKQNSTVCETLVYINDHAEITNKDDLSVDDCIVAKNIEEFCKKTNTSGGYYIGRYEARTETERKTETDTLTPVTSKANDYVYNYVTRVQASERCQSMYANKPFESDLVNSYAWDTAIIFFQEFGDDSTYARKMSVNSSLANTGTSGTNYSGTKDVICNVYDMASNCCEWTTENCTSIYSSPRTARGGIYKDNEIFCTTYRYGGLEGNEAAISNTFRSLIYM